ncbi:hypothetical protein HMPREF9441_01671 [Paraprevotella clara YIT 11840]|uniref:Uncharacterized protein n=1 Tax=Paraprevotella clara YIT 11840 TaxID=762968 RepID=G5SQN1_9BACT|nr:hypothetical protein HMPREF9441_01671 [Paraprevotella clara YIT 11840]
MSSLPPWFKTTIQSKTIEISNTTFRYQILSNPVSNNIRKYQASHIQHKENF